MQVEPTIEMIEADERKVKQIIVNLLANAVKFTPDGGRVEVTACKKDGYIEVAVRDTGIGISPGCVFRRTRTLISADAEHLFRMKPNGHFDSERTWSQ